MPSVSLDFPASRQALEGSEQLPPRPQGLTVQNTPQGLRVEKRKATQRALLLAAMDGA